MQRLNPSIKCSVKRCLCLTALIIHVCPLYASAKNYEVELKAGLNKEVLNYEEDTDKLVIRGGSCIKISDTFIFDFTTLRNMDDKISTYTWNITARDISGFMDFAAGNYNLHFGSGLMMGKKSYFSKDPFTKKISIAKDNTISLSNGGNPEYSLYGAALDFHQAGDCFKIYSIPFFSLQRRYISYDSLEAGYIDSSVYSLNTKIRKSGNYTEPVNILNYGGVTGLQLLNLANIQFYYFETDIKCDSGKDILWDKNKYYGGNGIDLIKNSGFFAEYSDKNISFFIEPALSSIKNGDTVTDFALAWGIGIQNSIMNFGLKGKNTGRDFHSEYSSGSRTPERIWETKLGYYPFKFLETGFIIYSEKDLSPAYNRDYVEGSIQCEIFTAINTDTIDMNFNVRRKEHYSTDRKDPTDQGNLTAGYSFSDRLYFRLRSAVQKNTADMSYLYGGETKFLFLNYMSISLGYTRVLINGEFPFYAVVTPATEHSSVTCFREPAHGGTVNFRYKKGKDTFYVRFTGIKSGSGQEGEFESALIMVF